MIARLSALFGTVLSTALMLAACTGAPKPETAAAPTEENAETFRPITPTADSVQSNGNATQKSSAQTNASNQAVASHQATVQTKPSDGMNESKQAETNVPESQTNVSESTEAATSEMNAAEETKNDFVDIYVEIPRLAQMALTKADSFYAAGELDSAAAIVEKFSVLNPLWKEWQIQAKSLTEKVKSGYSQKAAEIQQFLIALVNANSRRAAYAEVKQIADTIRSFGPSDSLLHVADSIAHIAYVRSFEKVKSVRDSALALAREKANFDAAEKQVSELFLRFSDFVDTLNLQAALFKISSLREEESSVAAEYWKSHDPQKGLAEAKKLSANKKWNAAKDAFLKLKASNLRGEAVRRLDSLYTEYCTEKRKAAAVYFAESKRKVSGKTPEQVKSEKLTKAISELDACLDFAPEFKDRATVLSNKQFLQSELAK